MSRHLRLCPGGHPADEPHTDDLDQTWICSCDDPQCCWRYDGNDLSQEEAVKGWNHRVPGPVTAEMLEWAKQNIDDFVAMDWPYAVDLLRRFIDEWEQST